MTVTGRSITAIPYQIQRKNMTPNLYEIFDEVSAAPDAEARKMILRKNDSSLLRTVLQYAFDPNIHFFMDQYPDGYIPNESPPGMAYGNLYQEYKKMTYFIRNHPSGIFLTYSTREGMLCRFLESFEKRESEVIIHMMQKNLQVSGLTEAVVRESFPDMRF